LNNHYKKGVFAMLMNYLDPGTGTMIISAIVGIFATVVLGFKTIWYKLTSFFTGKKNNPSDNNQ